MNGRKLVLESFGLGDVHLRDAWNPRPRIELYRRITKVFLLVLFCVRAATFLFVYLEAQRSGGTMSSTFRGSWRVAMSGFQEIQSTIPYNSCSQPYFTPWSATNSQHKQLGRFFLTTNHTRVKVVGWFRVLSVSPTQAQPYTSLPAKTWQFSPRTMLGSKRRNASRKCT